MGQAGGGGLRAGVAKRDITTSEPGVRVADPVYAKALVLDDGRTRLAIVAMDAVAIGGICDISDEFMPELRERVERELGILGGQVMVNASHTHPAGPVLCDHAAQVERTFAAIAEAAANLAPASLGVGRGREERIAINRTLRLKDGRQWTIRQAYPCPPEDSVAELGSLDPDIGIVRVDHADGRPLALLFNYACHPLIGVPGGGVTANFPGFACQVIEENLPGAMALYIQGAAGDVTEIWYKDVYRPRDCEPLGTMLGLSTLRAWRGIETGPASLAATSSMVALPRRADFATRLAAVEAEQAELLKSLRFTSLNFKAFLPLYLQHSLDPEHPGDYGYRYLHDSQRGSLELTHRDAENRRQVDKYLSNLRAMERLAKLQDDAATLRRHEAINAAAGEPTIEAEVQGLRLGQAVLVTSPAEVLTEVALRIKQASPFADTWVAAFSNGYIHYGASAADYDGGGYEVTECLLDAGWQELYEQTAAAVLARL
ncbi:MAG: hypothetical protein HUU35_09835 [Armatimonadetes bacterium]|nr:hypothetical protein [Armatimonadota bacterium]